MKKLTPLRAIRKYCLMCSETKEGVKNCWSNNCELYTFRMGKNPFRKGIGRAGGNPILKTLVR